jgi:RimJ/RimL family protein N-acetyltransferase
MHLIDGTLVIRNATSVDAEILCNWWNDGKIMPHAGFPLGLGTTAGKVALELASDDDDKGRRLILEIDSLPVGEMNYRNRGNKVVEIGIKICDTAKQDKGFGRRFLRMLIEGLFNEMGYERITLDTNLNNVRAQHVYEGLGFKKVATNLNSWRNQVGELQSSVDYALTREEYLTRSRHSLGNAFGRFAQVVTQSPILSGNDTELARWQTCAVPQRLPPYWLGKLNKLYRPHELKEPRLSP